MKGGGMHRLSDNLQKKADYADGEGPACMTEERKQRTHGRKNGEDEELRIMQHFVRDFIEGPDDAGPL
jgi:hypothetical protein